MHPHMTSPPHGLAIDVGNTNVVVGVFQADALEATWRLHTNQEKTADEYGVLIENLLEQQGLEPSQIGQAAICSVVPPLTSHFLDLCRQFFGVEACLLEPVVQEVMAIEYDNPAEVGADRIANAIALREIYGAPGIVVDLGTAITVDAVSPQGTYLGGAIAPGILTSLDALFGRAARLYPVELSRPPFVIGRNTVDSLRSGTVFGFAGMIEALVRRCKEELRGAPVVVATGGLAPLICESLNCIDHTDPHLTLKGLVIFARSRQAARSRKGRQVAKRPRR